MGLFTPKAQRWSEKGLQKLYYGEGTEQGLQLLEKAADASEPNAVLFLAELYYTGEAAGFERTVIRVPRDAAKAAALYERLPETLLVKYRRAMALDAGDGAARDEEKAFQLFDDVKNGRVSQDWAQAWSVFRFCFGPGARAYDGTRLQREAGMRVAIMQCQGRGTPKDEEQALRALEQFDSARHKEKLKMEEYWNPDALFYLEALRRQRLGEENYHYTGPLIERLTWVYSSTRSPEVKARLEEALLLPPAKARLREAAEQAAEQDTLVTLDAPLKALGAICRSDSRYLEELGDLAFDCLAPLRKAFITEIHYLHYFSCLEQVSAGMGNLRASCLLAEVYLSVTVTHTHARVSARGRSGWITETDYKKEARATMERMARQLQVLREGRRSPEHTAAARFSVFRFLDRYEEEAKEAAPEEYQKIKDLLSAW